MAEFVVKIVNVENITHDVKQFVFEKPQGYMFIPGQATEVAINSPKWKDEKRPFTFTGLNDAKHLEFVIKIYPTDGVTAELGKLKSGDELLIHDVWGAITYNGPGVFIAGGAGVTPFIAILRQLDKDKGLSTNKLIFSNKTQKDIILHSEFKKTLGNNFINILTREKVAGIDHGRIDKAYLKETIKDFVQNFYVCGPEKFTESVQNALIELGASVDSVVIEK